MWWISDPEQANTADEVVAAGTAEDLMKNENSITGAYLSGRKKIPVPKERRKPTGWLKVTGAAQNNSEKHYSRISTGGLYLRHRSFRFWKKLSGE